MDVTRIYETTVIINASLDDAQVEGVIARITETITKHGGTIVALNKWGRKRLAYAISKKSNGYYVNIEFTGPSASIALLERSYQLDEMVLRYLTIALTSKAIAAKKAAPVVAPAAELAPQGVITAREPLFKETDEKK
jgi:small subunit ribosomal protein S6